MFNFSEYRKNPDRVADLVPWVALIDKGVVLNKDGSFQRTLRFRGPDIESSTQDQLVSLMARLNNVLKQLQKGWVIYVEAKRHPSTSYPTQANFTDPVSWLIDVERKHQFETQGASFETDYYLTLQFLSPDHKKSFPSLAAQQEGNQENNKKAIQKKLTLFITATHRFADPLKDIFYEHAFLNDDETLTYLHSTISPKAHPIKQPAIPMYLDVLLADSPLITGTTPQLGDHYLGAVSILGFPASTQPALLEKLNELSFSYRWVTRFIALDKASADTQLKRYKKQWFAKRKGFSQLIQEIFTKKESALFDSTAVSKAKDVDEALHELAEDYVAYGYYTATLIVMDPELKVVEAMQREIERVINGLGFTTIRETYNAVEAFLSSLPGHAYANIRTPLIHTLNLSHLIPFTAVWPGPAYNTHLKAPPLLHVHTTGRTPFRFSHHIGDVGHHMIVGPTGSGKSVLLNLLALQFRRYKEAQVFIFDKGGSFLAPTLAVNGGYYVLGPEKNHLAFQPLAHIDQPSERVFAAEWLLYLFANENLTITPKLKEAVWEALIALSQTPESQRTITGLTAIIQDTELRQALRNYTIEGPFGQLFDANSQVNTNEAWQCYEMEDLMPLQSIITPTLQYLFHRLAQKFKGKPTLLILDEAWLFLDHPFFANKIKDWLKSLRKQNVSVIFATQSAEDALSSHISATLLESCPSRTLLPNDRVLEPKTKEAYTALGLNDKQLQILATATPKKQYYYQSRLGNRLFDLELGEVALAFCAASSAADKKLIMDLLNKEGKNNFLKTYLEIKNLNWAHETFHQFLSKKGVAF